MLTVGQRLGAFDIVRLVARGGMGAVYEGKRADGQFEQRVAIKVLPAWSADPAAAERIKAERQILSDLNHPYITRVIDGGETGDGTPYLVTEFIDGVPITEAVDDLGIDDLLALFCRVADAVHFAHRNLIIHRDIKPSNILVDAQGYPHLLDFGIATLIDARDVQVDTRSTPGGAAPMTIAYASPEQLDGGGVTTASDVYQLGLLLYRLLTGSLPDPRMARADGTVSSPSTFIKSDGNVDLSLPASLVKGDLDTIVLKALRPDPGERYGSAAELADDVRRYLNGEAITAKRESSLSMLRRLSRRNPVVAGLGGLATLVVVGWLVSLVVYSNQLEAERDTARRQAERAERIISVLSIVYQQQAPLHGDRATASPSSLRAAIDRAVAETSVRLDGEPDIQAELYGTFSELYEGLGDRDLAIELGKRSVDAYGSAGATAERLAAQAEYAGKLLNTQNDDALALFDEVLNEIEAVERSDPEAAVGILINVAVARFSIGSTNEAIYAYERGQDIYDDAGLENSSLQIELWFGLARSLVEVGRLDEAEVLLTQALTTAEQEFGRDHSRLTGVLNSLSALERSRGNYDRAIELSSRVVHIMQRDRAVDYESLLSARNNLALALGEAERYDEAAEVLSDVVAVRRELAGGSGSMNLAMTIKNHASMLHLAGRYGEALDAVTEAERMMQVHVPENSPYRATAHFTEALIHLDTGRLSDALASVTLAEEILVNTIGEAHYQVAVTRCIRAEILRRQGDRGMAASLVSESLERIAAAGAPYYEARCRHTREALAE
jgi:serine/threonine protein kinase